jgi:hypothetical protein
VGGLGDVVTSLSRAVQDLGHNVEVILPKYDCLNLSNVSLHNDVHPSGPSVFFFVFVIPFNLPLSPAIPFSAFTCYDAYL